jgi:hypothetical protein
MNNKKFICLFIAAPLFSIDADQCRDYFEEIKKGAPYADPKEAQLAFAKTFTRETKIAENHFVDELIKKEARRKALCASTFLHYGAYYTSQMKFAKFNEEFKKAQVSNPGISRDNFLNQYIQEKKANITDPILKIIRTELAELEDLQRDAKHSAHSIMALPEEKEMSKAWLPIIDKALENNGASQPVVTQDASADIEKYLK